MMTDPIVEAVRRAKESHAAQYGYDVNRIVAALREQQGKSGRKVLVLAPKKPVR
jgi:hypothetical protein